MTQTAILPIDDVAWNFSSTSPVGEGAAGQTNAYTTQPLWQPWWPLWVSLLTD